MSKKTDGNASDTRVCMTLKQAEKAFKNGPVPKMAGTMMVVLERILKCIEQVKNGNPPEAIGPYYRDEIARILATRTYLEYTDSDAPEMTEDSLYISTMAYTDEFGIWIQLLTAVCEYLHAAAVLAKSVNPLSTAARLYLRAWRIACNVKARNGHGFAYATRDEALAIIRLDTVASERLWVDLNFAKLPPFKIPRKTHSTKCKGKSPSKAKAI